MQNDHTQPPNITRKIRICYVQLATVRTCQKVWIWKAYQNFKSEDNDHLSITNCNRECFAKLAPCGFQQVVLA
jgi:hypothetical protein